MRYSLLSVIASVMFFTPAATAAETTDVATDVTSADVTSTDVYREVQAVTHDIERIRVYMGRPANTQSPINVSGVAPREVIYQASTLCEKVNRLGFETTRELVKKPIVPDRQIVPADVLRMIRFARGRIQRIGEELDLKLSPPNLDPIEDRTPTDVYKAIAQLNRQINLLLDQHFSPADVYQEVTLAIAHAANLRSRWPGDRIPRVPKLEHGKQPADVMKRLTQCFELVRSIADAEGITVLRFSLDEASLKTVSPSDVYDVAALLVAELAFLDRTLVKTKAPRKARYPGRKVPSDVYQRAGILLQQLEKIKEHTPANQSKEGS